jgi:hypothetical protein
MSGGAKGGHDDWLALIVGCCLRMNGRFAPEVVGRKFCFGRARLLSRSK